MAFDGARVPGESEAGDGGVAVSVDAGGEGVEAEQVVPPDGVESVRQTLALALGEHGREGPDVSGQSVDFGAMRPDGLELALLGLGEGVRVPEDPSGAAPSPSAVDHWFSSPGPLYATAPDPCPDEGPERAAGPALSHQPQQLCWPGVLRAIRCRLTTAVTLNRWWQAWTDKDPPAEFQALIRRGRHRTRH